MVGTGIILSIVCLGFSNTKACAGDSYVCYLECFLCEESPASSSPSRARSICRAKPASSTAVGNGRSHRDPDPPRPLAHNGVLPVIT